MAVLGKRFGEHIVYVEHGMGAYTLDVVKKSVFVGTAPYIKDLGTVLPLQVEGLF